jgi:hypothetical protein
MEPLTIGIIVCIIIAIILAVFFLTRSNTQNKLSLLDSAARAFGLTENLVNEKFDTNNDIVFNSLADIQNNWMVFFSYFFPKMEIDKINQILNNYGCTKTMQEILSEKKNELDPYKLIDHPLGGYYMCYIFDETNDDKIIENLKLYYIILTNGIYNIYFKNNLSEAKRRLIGNKTLPVNKSDLQYVRFQLAQDFKTSDKLVLYIKTNYNETIPLSDAIEASSNNSNWVDCLTSNLCTNSITIQELINRYKQLIIENDMATMKRVFNMYFALTLLKLNGSADNDTKFKQINEDILPLMCGLKNYYVYGLLNNKCPT